MRPRSSTTAPRRPDAVASQLVVLVQAKVTTQGVVSFTSVPAMSAWMPQTAQPVCQLYSAWSPPSKPRRLFWEVERGSHTWRHDGDARQRGLGGTPADDLIMSLFRVAWSARFVPDRARNAWIHGEKKR